MKTSFITRRPVAFTLVEMLVVIAIIALLASLTIGAYTFAMRDSKRRTTMGSMTAIKAALDDYEVEFGEFPQPAKSGNFAEILPGKSYDIGGAACLYQALRGDGYDQIAGVTSSGAGGEDGASDGKVEGNELSKMIFKDMPDTMWSKRGSTFFLIDAFARPFQYLKAAPQTAENNTNNGGNSSGDGDNATATVNATYDLWSYAEDDVNITKKSIDTLDSQDVGKKWITNWR